MDRPFTGITRTFFIRSLKRHGNYRWYSGMVQGSSPKHGKPHPTAGKVFRIFLRRGFGVYLIDQPRRGDAGRSAVPATLTPTPDEQAWFGTFRLGIWPEYFPGVQFSKDPETLNQYFRQMTPNTGPFDPEVVSDAVSELFNITGPAILVTHSQSGGPGWKTVIKNPNVRAVISYEPGSNFLFPLEELPAPLTSSAGTLEAVGVPMEEFIKLTRIPIILYYGDFIPMEPSRNPGQDGWRVRFEMAKLWRNAVNRHGGDVTLVHLPEMGIYGNTQNASKIITGNYFITSHHLNIIKLKSAGKSKFIT